jgi:hypothetical protein
MASLSTFTHLYVSCVNNLHGTLQGPFVCLQNPLEFLLRAAQIYPEKLALSHPDVQFPVFYTYSVWYDLPCLAFRL